MNNELMEVGLVANTRGLKGEIKIIPWCDYPEMFSDFNYLIINDNKYNIKSIKYFKNNVMINLEGIDSIDKAELLKNKVVHLYKNDLPALPEGRHYIKDLIGCNVKTVDNIDLGVVLDVLQTGANDVYEIAKKGEKPIYIPVIEDVIIEISIEKKEIIVKLLEGLI